MGLDSAIPMHLRRARSRSARVGEDYVPRDTAVCPKFSEDTTKVTVAYLGTQRRLERIDARQAEATAWLMRSLADDDGPEVIDRTQFVDTRGWINPMVVCYWRNTQRHLAWWDRIGSRWTRDADLFKGIPRFAEIFSPGTDRIEGILSEGNQEGLARLAGATTGPIREHGYWGSMRDRIPLSQTDELAPSGDFVVSTDGALMRIVPPRNLCVIRTGQDWSAIGPAEERAYLGNVEPSLNVSLKFMNNVGAELGCLCSRYARHVDEFGRPLSKAFNASIWLSLARLEHWAGSHWTHLASYGALTRHSSSFGHEMRLSRYHEVLVPAEDQVTLEYRECHANTGLCGVVGGLEAAYRPTSGR